VGARIVLASVVCIAMSCTPAHFSPDLHSLMRSTESRICVVEPLVCLTRLRSENSAANALVEENLSRLLISVAVDSLKAKGRTVLVSLAATAREEIVASRTVRKVLATRSAPKVGRTIDDSTVMSAISAGDMPFGLLLFVAGRYWAEDSRPYPTIASVSHAISSGGRYGARDTTQSVMVAACLVDRTSGKVVYSDRHSCAHCLPDSITAGALIAATMGRFVGGTCGHD
jgi:hypothetical protein